MLWRAAGVMQGDARPGGAGSGPSLRRVAWDVVGAGSAACALSLNSVCLAHRLSPCSPLWLPIALTIEKLQLGAGSTREAEAEASWAAGGCNQAWFGWVIRRPAGVGGWPPGRLAGWSWYVSMGRHICRQQAD